MTKNMKQSWELNDFVFAAITGALIFAFAFLLGSGIILVTGVPATGGIANILVAVFFMTIAKHIKPKFGFATLALAITFTIAIPTIIGGTPGVYKIIVGILIGLTIDFTVLILRGSNISYLIGCSFGAMVSIVSIFLAMKVMNFPGIEKLQPLMKYLIPFQGLNGLLGAFLGNKVFNSRLKDLSVIKKFME